MTARGKDEDMADDRSRNILIPNNVFGEFEKINNFSESNVIAFASEIGIAPGIVVGRSQKERCINHNMQIV